MASSARKYACGQIQATNAEILLRTVGFLPDAFRLTNLTNSVRVEWNKALPVGTNLKTAAAGDLTVITSAVEPYVLTAPETSNPGMKIPILADVNDTTTEMLLWEAWG